MQQSLFVYFKKGGSESQLCHTMMILYTMANNVQGTNHTNLKVIKGEGYHQEDSFGSETLLSSKL